MNKVDDFLQQIEANESDELLLELKRFLLDTFYNNKNRDNGINSNIKKQNALNQKNKRQYSGNDQILSHFNISQNYYILIAYYLNKTDDYLIMKNIILIYLNNDESIRIKTLGLKLLQQFLSFASSTVIKDDELFSIFVPIIIQYFHYIPPHFKINESLELTSELFKIFDIIFEKRLNTKETFERKHELILEIYSENIISLIVPTILLSKREDSTLLILVLKHLLNDYISKSNVYYINLRKLLNLFKPILEFPDYLQLLDSEVTKLVINVLEQLPLIDNTDDDFYKYNIVAYYILFFKFYKTENINNLLSVFKKNLEFRYGEIDSDISKIIDSI